MSCPQDILDILEKVKAEPREFGCHKKDRFSIAIYGKQYNHLTVDEKIAINDIWKEM